MEMSQNKCYLNYLEIYLKNKQNSNSDITYYIIYLQFLFFLIKEQENTFTRKMCSKIPRKKRKNKVEHD